jgi:general stress protein 26
MNANIFAKANQIIQTCNAVYIGVIDENGFPSVSTVMPVMTKDISVTYFTTNFSGNKARHLQRDKRASVCYHSGGNNITLVGEAEILTDQETKSRCWFDRLATHFPKGETDPEYCVIKIVTKHISLSLDIGNAKFTIDDLLTVQSRCGLLCKWCTYRESHGCGGCVETNGNPFHGECPVAKCCQNKGYTHCGECGDLPGECSDPDCKRIDTNGFFECGGCANTSCDKLYPYSYKDPDHGDNPPGARVEVCKAWAAKG